MPLCGTDLAFEIVVEIKQILIDVLSSRIMFYLKKEWYLIFIKWIDFIKKKEGIKLRWNKNQSDC